MNLERIRTVYSQLVSMPVAIGGLTMNTLLTADAAIGSFLQGDVLAGAELSGAAVALGTLLIDGAMRHDAGRGIFQRTH